MNRDEGIEIIRRAVADSLALDLDEVRAESRLITDLSADSLDFLAKLDLSSPQTMNGDYLKRDVVDSLVTRLPALRDEPDLDRIKPARLYGLITIETLWLMVADHLGK
jgi:hypothetical protein